MPSTKAHFSTAIGLRLQALDFDFMDCIAFRDAIHNSFTTDIVRKINVELGQAKTNQEARAVLNKNGFEIID